MSKASKIQKMIDYLIMKKSATREELAIYLNVNKKTITSYVNDVNADHHYYIESTTGKYGGYKLNYYRNSIHIDKSEMNALLIANEIIEKERPEIFPEFNTLTQKIQNIYEQHQPGADALPNEFYKASNGMSVDHSSDRKKEEKMSKAIENCIALKILYTDSHKNENYRIVEPYQIFSFKGGTYLIGNCRLREDIRIFKLSRVDKIEYTSSSYTIKKDYNLSELFNKTIGIHLGNIMKVKLKIFSPFDTFICEKKWVDDQMIIRESEDCVIFSGHLSDDEETITWLLSMKDCVEILQPEGLLNRYKTAVKKIFDKNFN